VYFGLYPLHALLHVAQPLLQEHFHLGLSQKVFFQNVQSVAVLDTLVQRQVLVVLPVADCAVFEQVLLLVVNHFLAVNQESFLALSVHLLFYVFEFCIRNDVLEVEKYRKSVPDDCIPLVTHIVFSNVD